MKTITIFRDTHRDACLDGCDDDGDACAYDESSARYFRFLERRAQRAGFELELSCESGGGRSETWECDCDGPCDCEADVVDILSMSFWDWY